MSNKVKHGTSKCGWCKKRVSVKRLHVIGFNPTPGYEVRVCEECLDEKRQFHTKLREGD